MPAIAASNFGIRPKSVEYGLLYAGFGFGAAAGAVSVGTIFVHRSKIRSVRIALFAFTVLLALFAVLRDDAAAYPVTIALGYAYFVVITSLSTVLQNHLRDEVRGRIMALWIMAFGGTVPLGVLAGGYAVRLTSLTAVLLVGAAVALGLVFWIDLAARRRPG
jgi:predicted MFS family arabinose efflux permease